MRPSQVLVRRVRVCPAQREPFARGREQYFTEMCSSSEMGSYSRLIDFVCPSTLGLRVIKTAENSEVEGSVCICEDRVLDGPASGKRAPRVTAYKYRGTSLIRNSAPLGPYSRTMSRALWWP